MSDTKIERDGKPLLGNGEEGNGHSLEIHDEHEPLRTTKTKAERREAGGDASATRPAGRPRTWLAFAVVGVAALGVGTAYYFWTAGYESTDDAFIAGHVVPVSSRVAGHVAKVFVNDNQRVKKGDLLVELDPADFETRLAAAEAAMQAAKKGQRSRSIGADVTRITSSAGMDEAAAAVDGAKAEVETARAAVSTAESLLAQCSASDRGEGGFAAGATGVAGGGRRGGSLPAPICTAFKAWFPITPRRKRVSTRQWRRTKWPRPRWLRTISGSVRKRRR